MSNDTLIIVVLTAFLLGFTYGNVYGHAADRVVGQDFALLDQIR